MTNSLLSAMILPLVSCIIILNIKKKQNISKISIKYNHIIRKNNKNSLKE